MIGEQHLFDLGPQVAVPTRPGLVDYPARLRDAGPDAKRTYRNKRLIEAGIHPVSKRRILGDGGPYTCGDCDRFFRVRRAKVYFKCELNVTGGSATDLRKGWPACVRFTVNLNTNQEEPPWNHPSFS